MESLLKSKEIPLDLPTVFFGGIAQLARVLAWHARSRGFESHYLHKTKKEKYVKSNARRFITF